MSKERHSFSGDGVLSEMTSPVSLRINSPVSGSVITKSDKMVEFGCDVLIVIPKYGDCSI
jgi:hypothetical protein